ncbi:MAG: hypothetical protein QXX95_00970 [Nitrososphaerales archaeon]
MKTIATLASITLLTYILDLSWFIGIPLTAIASVFGYARLGVVEKRNLIDIASALPSRESLSKIYTQAKTVIKLIYG